MKIFTVVGARPQFIKAATVSRVMPQEISEVIVHTGQHYDPKMSEIFFEELNIPKPKYNLGISGGTHAQMTGRMLPEIEELIMKEKPDKVLLYGDTNSTLAASLAAVKLNVPVYHVEAGNRFGTFTSPEEINRIVTDHVSTILMPCTQSAYEFLSKEGLGERSVIVGDPMYDSFLFNKTRITNEHKEEIYDLDGNKIKRPAEFYYMTCHRQENTADDMTLGSILSALQSLDYPTIYPVHPRNAETAKRICKDNNYYNILLVQAVGYLTSLSLVLDCIKVITDSGGVQREAFFAEKQCVTVLNFVVWPETMIDKRNALAKADPEDILNKLCEKQTINPDYKPFGTGFAAERIIEVLKK